ncbi:MAG: EAL domain-containing protein [Comamonadaceae bacterium]
MRIARQLKFSAMATLAAVLVLTPQVYLAWQAFDSAQTNSGIAQTIYRNFFERVSFRDQYFLYREDRTRALWDESKAQSDALLAVAKTQPRSETDQQALERVRVAVDDEVTLFHRIVDNTQAQKSAIDNRPVYQELDKRLYSQMLLRATEVRNATSALEESSAKQVERAYRRLILVAFALALALAAMIVFNALHIGGLLRRRLAPLHQGTKRVSAGDLTHRIKSDGTDEFSELAQSVNAMTEKLQQLTQGLEETVRERTAELRQSESHLRAIVESEPECIKIVDAQGLLTQMNPAGLAMIEADSLEQVLGRDVKTLLAPEYREAFAAMHQGVLAGESLQMEFEVLGLKGGRRWLETHAAPLLVNGQPVQLAITRDITTRKQAEEEVHSLAFSDFLTSLPNRRLLMDRLEQAMVGAVRHGQQGALLFVDMDDFKRLNDSMGHDKGDQLLKQIAQRVLTCVREGDTVARLGGDEFVVLLEDLDKSHKEAAKQAEAVARKIHNALRQPYQLDSHGYHSTASIGITLFGGAQRESIEEPLKRAELAMYKAKAVGRDNLRFFEPEMRQDINARARLEADLHEALNQAQFRLYYQAQVGINARLTGVEALVRWQHPERSLIAPDEFIPVAEDSGLILPLGHWVLETACKQLAAWALRPEMARLTISVNVSALQFRLPDFVEEVLTILETTGANPERLKLELTESLLLDNMKDIITNMTALKARGVGFSLDDFGTGYSSLSYLKRLPLDELKIDRGFVRDILTDPNDAAIAKMVVALAETMGLAVIAEGVETEAQRDALAGLGCHAYQGYLFSRPLPIDEFEAFARGV